MDFGLLGSLDQTGGIILYPGGGSSSLLTSSSSKMSLENAFGFALIQFCKATNGCTQSEPCRRIKIPYVRTSPKTLFEVQLNLHFTDDRNKVTTMPTNFKTSSGIISRYKTNKQRGTVWLVRRCEKIINIQGKS